MKNRVTIRGGDEHAAPQTNRPVPVSVAATKASVEPIAWTPVRPILSGESRNCRISQSTATRFSFEPILDLQYLALLIAGLLTIFMFLLAVSGQTPSVPYSKMLSTLDPTLTMFVYLFGTIALTYIGHLLRKPGRALIFDKNAGVFWIEKMRVFGWKVGESAQMPLFQIVALQILSSTDQTRQQTDSHLTPRPVSEYEVNVVFHSGERVNIINHQNIKAIRQDARALAEFLRVPIRDRAQPEYLPQHSQRDSALAIEA